MNVADLIEKLKALPPEAQVRARIPNEIVHRESYDVEFEILDVVVDKEAGDVFCVGDTD